MSYIGQAPGLGQRTAFRFVAVAGQTTFSGPDAQGYPMGYTPRLVDVYLNGRLLSEPDYTAADGSTIILGQGLTAGDELRVLAQAPFSPANTYTMAQADSFQRRRNRIIDPGMLVSQENGNNAVSPATGGLVYGSDSFTLYRYGATGAASLQRTALKTPGGSPYRLRTTVTAANPSPGAGDSLLLGTKIEGIDVADLGFGTAYAKTIAIRFGCRASVAGTYGVSVRNSGYNRYFTSAISIAPNEVGIDVVKSVTLTGDTTGAWSTDNATGLEVMICLLAGPNGQSVGGSWVGVATYGTASQTNLMATNGATFDLFDVGLYDVTGLQQGVIPPFELGSFSSEYTKCLRYYESGALLIQNPGAAGSTMLAPTTFSAPKRVSPTVSTSINGSASLNALNVNYVNVLNVGFQITISGQSGYAGFSYVANARL